METKQKAKQMNTQKSKLQPVLIISDSLVVLIAMFYIYSTFTDAGEAGVSTAE